MRRIRSRCITSESDVKAILMEWKKYSEIFNSHHAPVLIHENVCRLMVTRVIIRPTRMYAVFDRFVNGTP